MSAPLPTEADYPFDPALEPRLRVLQGTERIRAMRDRVLAQLSLDLLQIKRPNEMERARMWVQKDLTL